MQQVGGEMLRIRPVLVGLAGMDGRVSERTLKMNTMKVMHFNKHKIKLFDELCNDQQFLNAQLVGKNLFRNNPSDRNVFCLYFDFCIEQAEKQEEINSSSFFLSEADLALSLFCERCNMSKGVFSLIDDKRKKFIETSQIVNDRIRENEDAIAKQTSDNNEALIEKLDGFANDLEKTSDQSEFESTISKVSDAENALQKELFTQQQKERYDSISKKYSKLVTEKMRDFQRQNDMDYNLRAADSFKKAYDSFRNDGSKYKKNEKDFQNLICRELCCFDSARLFTETIMYFNFVYSYIFNAVNDDLKLKMTEYSIKCKKD